MAWGGAENFIPSIGNRIKKVNWWHEAIIDWMLAHPDEKLYDCAEYFNKTQAWISSIINSAAFKELLQQRKLMHSHYLSLTLTEKLEAIATQSLNVLEEKLSDPALVKAMSLGAARDTAEMALRNLGFTARSEGAITINAGNNANVVISHATPEALQAAREKMQRVQDTGGNGGNDARAEPMFALSAPS